jgi:two-component system response regulator
MVTSPSKAKPIVLVEDNSADVMLVLPALNNSGLDCELLVLDDGDKALHFIGESDANPHAGPIDLLLLDMHLPKHDGEEILNRLRFSLHYAGTPVLVMTASGAPRDHAQTQKHAAICYFLKPSDFDGYMQLGTIVRSLLSANETAAGVTVGHGVET